MNKKNLALLTGSLFCTLILCGCQAGQVEDKYSEVFQSDVVTLLNYTLEFERNRKDEIVTATAEGIISNSINRMVTVKVIAEFFDQNDVSLYSKSYTIRGLRSKGLPGSTTEFVITYSGQDKVKNVDYVTFTAYEEPSI